MFALDIFVAFNSAFYDEDYKVIDDRKIIARTYLKGWFLIDFFAIIPFEFLFKSLTNLGEYNGIIKIIRLAKIYKLIKLTRLIKMFKMFKRSNKFFEVLFKFVRVT